MPNNKQGRTGSQCVNIKGQFYQRKKSSRDKSAFSPRNIKAGYSDRENMSEVIASCYARAYLGPKHAPEITMDYDKQRHRVDILSKYLENTQHTLDEYYTAKEGLGGELAKNRHVRLVLSQETPVEASKGVWYIHPNTKLAQTLADATAVSAILGDHDTNPGNRMVLILGNELEIASIDFGHAFNDLIHAAEIFGGRLRETKHPIFDFFNRHQVADARLGGSISKIWRDYEGFVPSELLGDSLIKMGSNHKARAAGLKEAKRQFDALFKAIQNNKKDQETMPYIMRSFDQIHHALTGTFFPAELSNDEKYTKLFDTIDQLIQKNADDAILAGKMMKLQAQFVQAMHQNIDDLKAFSDLWQEKFKQAGLMNDTGEMLCPWFRTNSQTPVFKGGFEAYLYHERHQYLKAAHAEEMAQPKPNLTILNRLLRQLQQLFDYLMAFVKSNNQNTEQNSQKPLP